MYWALVTQTATGGFNEGFLRPDSLLVVIFLDNDMDWSAADTELFNTSNESFGPMNPRPWNNEAALHPISRYHDALLDLRRGDASRIIVAGIVGIPDDGSWSPGDSLDVLRTWCRTAEADCCDRIEVCHYSSGYSAYVSHRIVELAYSFDTDAVLGCVCATDWTATLAQLAQRIQSRL